MVAILLGCGSRVLLLDGKLAGLLDDVVALARNVYGRIGLVAVARDDVAFVGGDAEVVRGDLGDRA